MTYNIVFNNNIYKVEENVPIYKAFKDVIKNNPKYIACRYNNEIKSLGHPIVEDGEIEFLDLSNEDARYVYIRGLLYIMCKAFFENYPEYNIMVNYQLSNAMYCTIENNEVTEEILNKIKKYMIEIVKKNLPIVSQKMTQKEAEEFYKKIPTLRGLLQTTSKYKEVVKLYYCENYFNYFYGVMPISTGMLSLFDIEKYDKGFIIRYPDIYDSTKVADFVNNKKLYYALEDYNTRNKILKVSTVYQLNKKIKENQKDLILTSEAFHQKAMYNLSKKIRERKGVRIILIAGPSSSGKTTFASKLATSLKIDGLKPVTLSVDNYFVERENTPLDEFGNYNFESINAIDLELFNDHLTKLLNNEEIDMPTFDFTTGHKKFLGNKMKLNEDEILIIEGIHCLNDKLTSSIPKDKKFKIFISALTVLNIDYFNRISTTDTRLLRRIIRDYRTRNYSATHTIKMWYSVRRGERQNIFPYQESADFMFNSSLTYELASLKKYIIPLLEEITKDQKEYSEARRLISMLNYFEDIDDQYIPNTSLIREFIGGSIYEN